MAITQLGLHGPQLAYGTFQPKSQTVVTVHTIAVEGHYSLTRQLEGHFSSTRSLEGHYSTTRQLEGHGE